MGLMDLVRPRRKADSRAAELVREERQRRKQLEKQLKKEATTFQRLIVQRLIQLNLCYRYKKRERDWWESGVQSVRFLRTAASPEAIYLQIDTRHIPRGIRLAQLEDNDTLRDLSASCQRPVKVEHGKDGHDFWYVVERLAGVGGIPAKVRYEDMIAMMPKTAGPLTIPIGCGANKRQIFASMDDMEQLLVGGARGQGKSNFIDSAICTLIQRNSPDNLRMVMIDLKVVELTKYTRVPHLLMPVVVDEDGVMPALRTVFNEIQRRMKMFRPDEEKEPVCINISGWNYKFRDQPLPYWLLIIDEMAEVTAVGGDDALFLLQRIGALGRAAGVYGMLATQRPSSSIIPGEIKAHYPTRVAFSCADGPSSMTLIDNYDAVRLPGPGHFIFGYRDQRIHLKAPLLGPKLVEQIVAGVLVEKPVFEEIQVHNVTAEDMFRFALQNFEGDFSWRKIYKEFRRQGVTRTEIRDIGSKYEVSLTEEIPDDKIIQLDGQSYILVKGDGTRPRHLVGCEQRAEDSQPEGYPENGESPEDLETVPAPELSESPMVPQLPAVPGGNGDGAEDDVDAVLLGALDADANGAVDDDCETCRAANDGWCPGTCETILKMNERETA